MIAPFASFSAGFASFFAPCILPILPALFAVLLEDADEIEDQTNIKRDIAKILPFIGGFTMVFVAMGLAAGGIGRALLTYQREINIIGGAIITIMGFHMLELIEIPVLMRGGMPAISHGSNFVLGMIFSASWTPCISPILTSILIMVAGGSSALGGAGLLASYAAGLAIPLMGSALLWRRAIQLGGKTAKWGHVIKKIAGLILLILGLSIMTGYFEMITSRLL